MDNNNLLLIEKRLVTRFLDMFIRFGLILALASFCFTVFSPFINMMLWALILAVALYPLHQYFAGLLAGKQGLASVVLVLLGILLIVIPTVLMITSLAESASAMIDKMGSQSFTIPPPSSRIAALPIIGERLSALWMRASVDLPGLLSNYRSQIGDIAKQFLSILASMSGGLIGFIISFIVSGIMMAWGAAGAISAQRIAIRITDENKGVTLTRLCTSTIRAVAQGVIGVALIQALLVGVIMLMASIPAVGIFFILALILNNQFKGRKVARAIVVFPWATTLVIQASAWKFIINTDYGALNTLLKTLGIIQTNVNWTPTPGAFFAWEIACGIFVTIPFVCFTALSGLQSIDSSLYEAAIVDGASYWQKLFHITLPLVKPSLTVATVLNIIYVFNSFPIVWTITKGDPASRTDTLVTYLYKLAFYNGKQGEAAAVSVIGFLILLVCASCYMVSTLKKGED